MWVRLGEVMPNVLISIGTQIEAVRDEVERHTLALVQTSGSRREAKIYLISRLQAAVETLEQVREQRRAAE